MTDTTTRPHISELLDEENLQKMIAERMINVREYPELGLRLYDYSQFAQFSRTWNTETKTCRGLITTTDGFVVARGFPKFANFAEHAENSAFGPLPLDEPFEMFEKLDGSLGILYRVPGTGELRISTRGSLMSDQAKHATALFQKRYGDQEIPEGVTYLFEIIYPQYEGTCPTCELTHLGNRIVVNYGTFDDLVLLAVLDNATGLDLPLPADWPGPVVKRYESGRDLAQIAQLVSESRIHEVADGLEDTPDFEGFVVRFKNSNIRSKIKGPSYLIAHAAVDNLSTKSVWEALSTGQSLEALVELIPDEYYVWVQRYTAELQAKFDEVLAEATSFLAEVQANPEVTDRKSAAALIRPHRYFAVIFQMMDGRDPAPTIWRMIEPPFAKASPEFDQ